MYDVHLRAEALDIMLTQTSETAIRALIYMALHREREPMTPRHIAEKIDASPTYLVKTLRQLVKAGILRSRHGAHGGVELGREPSQVTLLDIVEVCQGLIVGNYCSELDSPERLKDACGFHQAMQEVHDAMIGPLRRWTLAGLAARPAPTAPDLDPCACKMTIGCRSLAEMDGPGQATQESTQ